MILYLVASAGLFDRRGTPYCTPEGADWQDNHLRFARLSLAAAEIAAGRGGLGWTPDVVHANDWPGGLTPAYMRWDGSRRSHGADHPQHRLPGEFRRRPAP